VNVIQRSPQYEVGRARGPVRPDEPRVEAGSRPIAEPPVDEHPRDPRSKRSPARVEARGETEQPSRGCRRARLGVAELPAFAELDDAVGLRHPDLAGDGAEHAEGVARREAVDVLVVVQPPKARAARGAAEEPPQVPRHVGRVEHVGGHHAERSTAAQAAERAVIADREPRAPERRLGDVVDLVPRRVGAHPRVAVVESPDRGPIGARRRRPAVGGAGVAAVHVAASARRERDEDFLAPQPCGRHERVHLGGAPRARPVPGDEVADVAHPQLLPGRRFEHLRALLADADPVCGARRARRGEERRRQQGRQHQRAWSRERMSPQRHPPERSAGSGSGRVAAALWLWQSFAPFR
jgi:hypothetical protein